MIKIGHLEENEIGFLEYIHAFERVYDIDFSDEQLDNFYQFNTLLVDKKIKAINEELTKRSAYCDTLHSFSENMLATTEAGGQSPIGAGAAILAFLSHLLSIGCRDDVPSTDLHSYHSGSSTSSSGSSSSSYQHTSSSYLGGANGNPDTHKPSEQRCGAGGVWADCYGA